MSKKETQSSGLTPDQLKVKADLAEVEKEYRRQTSVVQGIPLAKNIAFGVWAAFDLLLLVVFLLFVVGYLVSGQFADRQEVASTAQNQSALREFALGQTADALRVDDAVVLDADGAAVDVVAVASNPNEQWYASFEYYFETNTGDTPVQEGVLLPQTELPFVALNVTLDESPSRAALKIENIAWQRISSRRVGDYEDWLEERNDFTVTDVTYDTEIEIDDTSIARSSVTIENNAAFDYWSVPFVIELVRNGRVIGVNQFSVANFEANEVRTVELNWFGNAPRTVDDLQLTPVLDYFDDDIYMPRTGGDAMDLRDQIDVD
jgi:hypothetical protein